MNNPIYKKGLVYKLYSQINDIFYVGSTGSGMHVRLHRHKKKPPSSKVKEWFEDVLFQNIRYIILAEYDNISRIDLKIKEDEEVEKFRNKDNHCLNQHRVYTGLSKVAYDKQRYENNKEVVLDRVKQYSDEHREEINRKKKEKIKCDNCGSLVQRGIIAKHKRTPKCTSHRVQ